MSSHQLAIAKAALAAALLRPDPSVTARDEIEQFHTLLGTMINQCSRANVQKCRIWITSHIISSASRCTASGKYLTALSNSFTGTGAVTATPDAVLAPVSATKQTSARRKRLHILYLINDVLHHAQRHERGITVVEKLRPYLESLFNSAAAFEHCPKQQHKLLNLLELWEEKGYYETQDIDKLRQVVLSANELDATDDTARGAASRASVKQSQQAPYSMPSSHGDPSTPWYDLPAGNLMAHIVPNSSKPINPGLVKPLQFVAGPADERLVAAVKELLREVDDLDNLEKDAAWDIDEMGQLILPDEELDDGEGGESYYGWSKAFCKKMRARHQGKAPLEDSRSRSRSSSEGSYSLKRRRYGDSEDDDRGRSRSRLRFRRQGSDDSSHSRDGRPGFQRKRSSRSRSRSYSNSGSRSRDRGRRTVGYDNGPQRHGRRQSRSISRSISPVGFRRGGEDRNDYPGQPQQKFTGGLPRIGNNMPFPIPVPGSYPPLPGQFPLPGGIPIPPPPPPNYMGQWPPPPPPPNSGQQNSWAGIYPPPPPPPGNGSVGNVNQQWPPAPPSASTSGPTHGTNPWDESGSSGGWHNQGYGRGGRGGDNQYHQNYRGGSRGGRGGWRGAR